ncbi:MAG: Ca-activated chloride channel family protein, partial [Kiritimatiellia bacterium]
KTTQPVGSTKGQSVSTRTTADAGESTNTLETIVDMPTPERKSMRGLLHDYSAAPAPDVTSTGSTTGPMSTTGRYGKDLAQHDIRDKHADNKRSMSPTQPPVSVQESVTEDYTDYGVNGFSLTDRDHLSTFAVDVDTASYTITRRKLTDGYLPPRSAVRVEEFVNYFPYEYTQPKPGDPFAVDMEASPSPYNPANHIVRVGVQGKKVAFDSRKPVHLTFLVDVSGSMQSRDKIGMLKDSLKMLTNELQDGDTVAIATYAGATKVVLRPTPMSRKSDIIRALDGLNAGGSTAMGAGIDLAYGLADSSYRDGAVNRVIVCSDGDANVGQTSHSALSTKIEGYANKGITLTTIGFGNGNYNDTMMERLANEGDGNYFYIDSLKESRRIFIDKLSSTLEVIAKDVKIQVDWNKDAVIAYRLIGYENRDVADHDFRNDAVDAGEIGAGHQVTALYEVALADDPKGSLGTVHIRNKAPGPDAPAVERSYDLSASAIQTSFAASSAQLRLQVASVGFAEILRGSPHMNEISLHFVADIARGAQRVEYDEDRELVKLIERASQLKGEGAMVSR